MMPANVDFCSRVPGDESTASLFVSVFVFPCVAASMFRASRPAGTVPLTASTWNVPFATRASGRLVSCTRRHVDGSTHSAPCSR